MQVTIYLSGPEGTDSNISVEMNPAELTLLQSLPTGMTVPFHDSRTNRMLELEITDVNIEIHRHFDNSVELRGEIHASFEEE